jgi:hypothetical protein
MFPHPDTVWTTSALEYQERLRLAARDRLAAPTHAQEDACLSCAITRTVHRVADSWLRRWLPRLRGANQVDVAHPMASC